MSELNVALAAVGGLLVVLGLLTNLIKDTVFVSEPLLALLAGVLIGPAAFGLLDLAAFGDREVILEGAARLTLAVALMGVALRLPVGYFSRNWRSLVVLLGLLMPLMWLSGGLLAYLILGLSFPVAMLVGAVVTPTDPVVASSIVTGGVADRNLPERLRHAISAESGFNDGLAYPFVLLPILFLMRPPGDALSHWLAYTILWEVGAAVVLGALVGYGTGRLLMWAEARETSEHASLLTVALALALAALGAASLIGSDGILAVFVAGMAFDATTRSEAEEQRERVQEAITRFFDLPIFVLLGMALPWEGWLSLGWAGLSLAVAVLLLRRLPAVLALSPLIGQTRGRRDALFVGWFGPIGAAALYYAALAHRETGNEEIWVVGSLIICASVLAHGLTATLLTKLYGRHA
ncbi:MAG: cation:proton antiporter [Actinomycetota bacterium]|nr:cation:proton antiporter [Actinomycetota bacterium]